MALSAASTRLCWTNTGKFETEQNQWKKHESNPKQKSKQFPSLFWRFFNLVIFTGHKIMLELRWASKSMDHTPVAAIGVGEPMLIFFHKFTFKTLTGKTECLSDILTTLLLFNSKYINPKWSMCCRVIEPQSAHGPLWAQRAGRAENYLWTSSATTLNPYGTTSITKK